jgi:hypothetical protein
MLATLSVRITRQASARNQVSTASEHGTTHFDVLDLANTNRNILANKDMSMAGAKHA